MPQCPFKVETSLCFIVLCLLLFNVLYNMSTSTLLFIDIYLESFNSTVLTVIPGI